MILKEIREERGVTQWDIRIATGIHQSKISLIENGYVLPTDREKKKIAQALGVAVPEIDWCEAGGVHAAEH